MLSRQNPLEATSKEVHDKRWLLQRTSQV